MGLLPMSREQFEAWHAAKQNSKYRELKPLLDLWLEESGLSETLKRIEEALEEARATANH